VRVIRAQRDLPAGPGAGFHADGLQRDGQQAGGDLFAGGDHRIVFARVVQRREGLAPGDKLVGRTRHRRDDDGNLIPLLHLVFHARCDVADSVEIGDGGAAELHHDAGH